MVVLRSKNEIEGLRQAGDLVVCALVQLHQHVRAGVRLSELDRIVEEFIRCEGGEPIYKGYRPSPSAPPFPGTICTAVNEEIVHGIPGPRRLRDGDIVGIDVGATLGSWVGDTCYTYPVGDVSPRARKLLDVAGECLEAGIAEVGPGNASVTSERPSRSSRSTMVMGSCGSLAATASDTNCTRSPT
jgi:methionyl aminopeptidase